VLYKHDFEADVILLGLISAIVGYSVYGSWAGWDPIFGGSAGFSFSHPAELPYYAILGLFCGLLAILYARGFYGTIGVFHKIRIPRMLKPAIGGLIVGTIGMFAPESIHVGYGTVQRLLTVDGVKQFSPWLLLTLPLLRIATTSLTVGSGGSGGIFGPGMVIGGIAGAAAWRFGQDLPGFPAEPGPVVIICMIALFGSVAHAPLAMLLMVGEMTGNLSLLAPAMVAVAIATLVVGDTSIYESQVLTRADSPAHRHRFAFPLLTTLPASRAVVPVASIAASGTVGDARAVIEASPGLHVVALGEDGKVVGEVSAAALRSAADADPGASAAPLIEPLPAVVAGDATLDRALDLLAEHERSWLPVVGDKGRPLGVIDARSLMRSYRQAAVAGVRPVEARPAGPEFFEVEVPADAPVAGRRLREAGFPPGVRVVAVDRDSTVLVADGDTLVLPGDRLTLSCRPGARAAALGALFGS
jgi:CIC family chloride channel protein